jgi:antibiotic biosynthesis monooxygenase (ABM) superfamily enzyme
MCHNTGPRSGTSFRRLAVYGTVARLRLKPGMESKFRDLAKSYESLKIPGHINTTVYRLDAGNDEYLMAVVFSDKGSYERNANSPEQDKRYQEMRALLAADPQWMDGEVIYHMGS